MGGSEVLTLLYSVGVYYCMLRDCIAVHLTAASLHALLHFVISYE